jgi:cullin 1
MFTDISLSRDINEDFRHAYQNDLSVEFSVLVLATGSWPLHTASTRFEPPAELIACRDMFQEFYSKKHNGRKLNWLYQHSKNEIKALTFHRIYTLQCSTYQAAVLALFNDTSTMTMEQIQESTQLSEPILCNTLMTLVKTRILNSKPSIIVKLEDDDGKAKASLKEPTKDVLFGVNKQFKKYVSKSTRSHVQRA